MEITKISPQTKNPERVNLFVDGKFHRGLDRLVAIKLGLKPGLTLTPKLLTELERSQSHNTAWEYALLLLRYGPRSIAQMHQRLSRKFTPGATTEVIKRLKEAGLLDDNLAAEQLATSVANGRRSRRQIESKLLQRGFSREVAKVNLAKLDPQLEEQAALELARRRFVKLTGRPWREQFQNIAAYLSRRGFNYNVIARTVRLERLSSDAEQPT
ncbi:MAG: RecX family transcriptional regulator [bacterium]